MVTVVGGSTITSSGLTPDQLKTASTLLSQQVSTGSSYTDTKLGASGGAPIATVPLQATVTMGNLSTNTVRTSNIDAPTGSSSTAVVSVDANTGGATGVLTNVGVGDKVGGVVVGGTGDNNVTAVIFNASSVSKTAIGSGNNEFFVLDSTSGSNSIYAGSGSDTVLGGSSSDTISANGTAIINGGAGSDTIVGGTGFSTLGGGAGDDWIVAGSGGSLIIGETGNDSLVAGAGKDVFIFRPGDGNDTISGFDPSQDTIGFSTTNYGSGTLDLVSLMSNAKVSGGNTILTLPDGSTITVVGQTGANINWFTSKS